MKTITISNLKGGVGKTTSAANLAYSLRLAGHTVLVVDLDPQCNLTPFFSGKVSYGHTVTEVLSSPQDAKSHICPSRYDGISVIEGNTGLSETVAMHYKPDSLVNALESVSDGYDFCIIDTRPVFEILTGLAVLASDLVLTPVCLDKFCRDNLALVEDGLVDYTTEFFTSYRDAAHEFSWHVFATKVDARRKAQRAVYEDLMTAHDYPILDTCISSCAAIDNALGMYRPVAMHRSGSRAAKDYQELAAEILSLPEMEMNQGRTDTEIREDIHLETMERHSVASGYALAEGGVA